MPAEEDLVLSVEIPLTREVPRLGRAHLDRLALPPDVLDDLKLIASELLANSARHSGQPEFHPIHLEIARVDRWRYRLTVNDGGPGFAREIVDEAPREDPSARLGLALVGRLAEDWGVAPGGVVWAKVVSRVRPAE